LYPELQPDIEFPNLLSNDNEVFSDEVSGLWIGTSGNITPLHYDLWHGFLVQIVGKKSVLLFPPDDSSCLYQDTSLGNSHLSQVDICTIHSPEQKKKFSKFRDVAPYHAILSPGDMLYIPPCWWHDVISLDDCISVTLRWHLGQYENIHPCALK